MRLTSQCTLEMRRFKYVHFNDNETSSTWLLLKCYLISHIHNKGGVRNAIAFNNGKGYKLI